MSSLPLSITELQYVKKYQDVELHPVASGNYVSRHFLLASLTLKSLCSRRFVRSTKVDERDDSSVMLQISRYRRMDVLARQAK